MATPTAPPVAPRPVRHQGVRGRLVVSQQRLLEPLILEQDVLDPTWNKFKTFMVFLGGILFFLVFGGIAFTFGVIGAYRTHPMLGSSVPEPQVIERIIEGPAPVAQPQPTPAPAVQPPPDRELTPEELDRRHSEYLHRQGQ